MIVLVVLLFITITGCQKESKENTQDKPFKDQKITVIVPNIGDRVIRGPIMKEAKLFEERTGATVRVVTPGWESTIKKTKDSLSDPNVNFDIFVIITNWGGFLLGDEHIAEMPDWVKDKIDWDDVLPIYKENILSWGNKTYGFPYDGDCVTLYYRKDIFNNKENKANFLKQFGYELEVPTTWTQYRDIAMFFNNWDWDNDGEIEYGAVEHRLKGFSSTLQFFTRAASYAKHPSSKSFYFDSKTMKPNINNPGFVKALEEYVDIIKFGPKGMINFQVADIRKSFVTGDVAMAIDWGDTATMSANSNMSSVKENIGYAILPGYDKVYNSDDKKWDAHYNNVSSISGNWTILVNKNSNNKKLAFEFALFISSKETTKKYVTLGWSGINPSRHSHFDDIKEWERMGFSKESANEYLKTTKDSLSNNNVMVDIRIPGASDYYNAIQEALDLAVRGKMSPKEALDMASKNWNTITDKLGRQKQLKLYNESMNE